jgi:hypothetical protein
MGLLKHGSKISSSTVHSVVTAGSAGGLGSDSAAIVLGLAQVQGEPRLNLRYRSHWNTCDNSPQIWRTWTHHI